MKCNGTHPGNDNIRRMYQQERMSTRQIAKLAGVSASTVRFWLKCAGVVLRSISDAKHGQKPAAHTVEASVRSRRKNTIAGMPVVGYKKRADGYVALYMPNHPDAVSRGYVLQHRIVAEEKIGRRLRDDEDVHHINHDRADNRPENIQVLTHSEHLLLHSYERIRDVGGRFT